MKYYRESMGAYYQLIDGDVYVSYAADKPGIESAHTLRTIQKMYEQGELKIIVDKHMEVAEGL